MRCRTPSSESEFVDAAGSSDAARTFARNAWSAREALGARDVGLRYITGGDVADRADGSTQADVEVSWMAGGESGLADALRTSTAKFRLDPQADGTFAVRSVRPASGSLPIWLAGKVEVDKQADTVVITVDGGVRPADRVDDGQGSRCSGRRPARAHGASVVVVSPHTAGPDGAARRSQGRPTSTRSRPSRPTSTEATAQPAASSILLNPAVFATMDQRAAQVVLSHEATHLLTSAVGTTAETWVVEGFADFVALHDDDAPLSLSAGQVLAEVKAGKTPKRLPTVGRLRLDGPRTRRGRTSRRG